MANLSDIDTCNKEEQLYSEINDDMENSIVKINYVRNIRSERSYIMHQCKEKEKIEYRLNRATKHTLAL